MMQGHGPDGHRTVILDIPLTDSPSGPRPSARPAAPAPDRQDRPVRVRPAGPSVAPVPDTAPRTVDIPLTRPDTDTGLGASAVTATPAVTPSDTGLQWRPVSAAPKPAPAPPQRPPRWPLVAGVLAIPTAGIAGAASALFASTVPVIMLGWVVLGGGLLVVVVRIGRGITRAIGGGPQ